MEETPKPNAEQLLQALRTILAEVLGTPSAAPQPTEGDAGPEFEENETETEALPDPVAPRGVAYQCHKEAGRTVYAVSRDPFAGPRATVYAEPVEALGVTEPGTARVLGVPVGDPLTADLYAAGASWEPSRHAWRFLPSAVDVATALEIVGLLGTGRTAPTV